MPNLKKAIRLAHASLDLVKDQRQRHFSFIFFRNRIVGFGWNKSKSHPKAALHDAYATHSELDVLNGAMIPPYLFPRCTLVNIRIKRNGSLGLARPCRKCQSLLDNFRFRDILYSTDDQRFVSM